jgi:tetratricopeptide (TPR) repeat protein
MAEEDDREFQRPSGATAGAAAWSALSSASRETADAFLKEQTAVLRLEKEKLAKEDAAIDMEIALNLSHLRMRRFSDYARVSLEVAGFLVVLLIVCGLGTMVWNATQDHDLVVDAFSVPPDMAQTGLTGGALANRVLDRFGAMDRSTHSFTQDLGVYHGNASDDVRVEIPETGISLGELNRYLRAWLGHETHVTGELVRGAKSLALTVRYGDNPGIATEAPAENLDKLVEKSAENIFRAAHPLRFADYLSQHGRLAEADAIAHEEAHRGDDAHRSLAYVSLGYADYWKGDQRDMGVNGQMAVHLDPTSPVAWFIAEASANNLGHIEDDLKAARGFLATGKGGASAGASDFARSLPVEIEAAALDDQGDLKGAIDACARVLSAIRVGMCNTDNMIYAYALLHDFGRARDIVRGAPDTSLNGKPNLDLLISEVQLELIEGSWAEAVTIAGKAESSFASDRTQMYDLNNNLRPSEAEALARTGDIVGARKLLENTAPDCDACALARGRVAMAARDWATAADWFAVVAARSPDIPLPDAYWGEMLLVKGDVDGAIAKFKQANTIGPHFADPIEMWGEALMLKNRSDLALARFEDAAKYAPNWGRLHLKWGEALFYAGKPAEAKTQIAIANGLVLSAADRAVLTKWRSQHG